MACPSLSARSCCLAASRSNVRQLDPRTPMMQWSPQFAPSHGSVGCRHLFPKFSLVLRLTPFALCAREVLPCSASLVSVLQCNNAGTHTISGVVTMILWQSTRMDGSCQRHLFSVCALTKRRVLQTSQDTTPESRPMLEVGYSAKGTIPKPNDIFVSGLKLVVLWST